MRKTTFYVFLLITLSFATFYSVSAQSENLDSLKKSLIKLKNDTNKVNVLYKLSVSHLAQDLILSKRYAYEAFELSKKINWESGVSKSYKAIGNSFYYSGELDSALFFMQKALSLDTKSKNQFLIASTLNSIANVYLNQPDFETAMEYYFKALNSFEKLNDKEGIALTLGNIGLVYKNLENYNKAIEYFNKAIKIHTNENNKRGLSTVYNSLGQIYNIKKDYSNALKYYNEALKINVEIENLFAQSIIMANIAIVYDAQEKMDEASNIINKVIEIDKKLANKRSLALHYGNLSDFYFKKYSISKSRNKNLQQLLDSSIIFAQNAVKIQQELLVLNDLIYSFRSLYNAYKEQKNYEKALEYYENYANLNDSLFSGDKKVKVMEIDEKRQKEINEKTISLLVAEKKLHQLQNYTLLGLVVFLLLLIYFIYVRFRDKKILSENLKVSHQQIEEQHKIISEANETKNAFFSIIAHDLRGPMSAFKNLTSNMVEQIDEYSREDLIDTIETLNQSAKNTYNLLENLLTWSQLQTGKIQFHPDYQNLRHIVEMNLKVLTTSAKNKSINLKFSNLQDILISCDVNFISTVIRNLVSNAIKFTNTGGEIKIELLLDGTFAKVIIEDNGIGMSDETISHLFRIDQSHTSLGTEKEKGTGLGLILCKEFIERHNGKIWVESQFGVGSKFIFTLPIE